MRLRFHYNRYVRTLPMQLVQDVWNALTKEPQADIRTLAERTGYPRVRVELALLCLRHHTLIAFDHGSVNARTILPPKYELKASYLNEVV